MSERQFNLKQMLSLSENRQGYVYICEENVHLFSSHVNEYGQHPMNRDTYRNDIYMLSLQSQKLIKENNAEDTPASGICNVDAVTAHVIHNASYVILSSST